jgi:hypothetical protein
MGHYLLFALVAVGPFVWLYVRHLVCGGVLVISPVLVFDCMGLPSSVDSLNCYFKYGVVLDCVSIVDLVVVVLFPVYVIFFDGVHLSAFFGSVHYLHDLVDGSHAMLVVHEVRCET